MGCVDFLGIVVTGDGIDQTYTGRERPFLVFERASEGPLIPFLQLRYKSQTFFDSWEMTLDAIEGVANGLYSLHKHDVLHR